MDAWIWKEWLSEEEEAVVRRALDVLESLGASLTAIHLPRCAAGRATLSTLIAAETPVYFDDHFTPEQRAAWPEWHATVEQGRGLSLAEYLHAQQTRALICQELTAVLRQVDVIAMPTGSTFGDAWDADTVDHPWPPGASTIPGGVSQCHGLTVWASRDVGAMRLWP